MRKIGKSHLSSLSRLSFISLIFLSSFSNLSHTSFFHLSLISLSYLSRTSLISLVSSLSSLPSLQAQYSSKGSAMSEGIALTTFSPSICAIPLKAAYLRVEFDPTLQLGREAYGAFWMQGTEEGMVGAVLSPQRLAAYE